MVFLDVEDLQQYLVGQLTSAPYDIAAAIDDEEPTLLHLLVFQANGGDAACATLDRHHDDTDDLVALSDAVLVAVATAWALFFIRRPLVQ